MPDLTIQPTTKFLKAGTILAVLIFIGLEAGCVLSWNTLAGSQLIMLAPPLILLWPFARYMRWRSNRLVVTGDRLRHEVGLMSKDIRTIEVSKLQFVRVHQTVMQRMFGVGDIGFETAGQGTWQGMKNVEKPQELADEIMNRAGKGTA